MTRLSWLAFAVWLGVTAMVVLLADGAVTDTTFVHGFVGEPEGGFDTEWFTHLGRARIRGIRQQPPNQRIQWQSAVLPAEITTEYVTFCWTGAMGGRSSPSGSFAVSVNGHRAAHFDVVMRSTRFLAHARGCELLYAIAWVLRTGLGNEMDSSGYFTLTVPAAWVRPGEAARLAADSANVGSPRWFGLIAAEDAPLRMPRREWINFSGGKAPVVPAAADPPPAGQEADYAWYLRQYTDPSVLTTIGPPADPCQVSVSRTGQLFYGSDLSLAMRGSDYRISGTWPVIPIKSLGFALYEAGRVVPIGVDEDAQQSLDEGLLPIVSTRWKRGDVDLRQTAFAEPFDGAYHSGLERTLAWAALDVTNTGKSTRDVTLLGFYTGTNEAPRPTLEYRDGAVLMDGSAFVSGKAPEGFTVTFCPVFPVEAAPGENDDPIEVLRSHAGVYNALVVRGTIPPGGTVRVVFNRVFDSPGTIYQKPTALVPVAPAALTGRSLDEALDGARETWRALAARTGRFETPEPLLNNIVRKAMLDGYFLTKRWDGRTVVFDSIASGYLCQWDDASTKWFYALDLMGDHATAERLLDTVFERQGERKPAGTRMHEGCFSDVTNTAQDGSAASWASCNGWTLWAMWQHARLSNDRAWVAKHKDKILAGCEWIMHERAFSKEDPDSPFAGLLAGRFTCDSGDEAGYMVYTDAVSYLGLRGMARLLADWGHPEGARLLAEAEAYRTDILAAVDRATDKSSDPWYIPRALSDPESDHLYHYANTGPLNLAFGGVVPAADERIDHVIRWMLQHAFGGSLEGLVTGSICYDRSSVTGCMFYGQDLAVVLLELDRVEEFLRILYTLLASNVGHETLTTCEWRSNTMPHIHSVSSLVRMVRTMLIQERDGALVLLQGTPRRWLADGETITIREAPTWYGPLSLRCTSRISEGRVSVELSLPERIGKTPVRLKLRLPQGLHLNGAVTGDGRRLAVDSEWIELTGLHGQVEVTAAVARK